MPDYPLWMPPEIALEADGVVVYRTYRDDGCDPYEYWYTQDPEDPDAPFDIRDLAAAHADLLTDVASGDHGAVLRRLVEHKILRPLADQAYPFYDLTCPRCRTHTVWTVSTVTVAPDTPINAWGWVDPDAVTVSHIRCGQCRHVYPLADFQRPASVR